MRGAPGCGKSTFIKQHNLEPYTLCADTIRMQYSSTCLNLDGDTGISQQHDNVVWKTLFDMLEYRMKLGCFTVIDATNSKTKEMKRYKDLASQYRYRIFVVDMTDVPLEVCIERNAVRPAYKQVPVAALENIYARFATQDVPSGITVVKPDEFETRTNLSQISFDCYENVHIIGDVHGCYTPLIKYMTQNWSDSDMYVFLGDYLDRGTENANVFKYLYELKDKPNVLLLEGNHERWLRNWGNDDEPNLSSEFRDFTLRQLQEAGIDKKLARNFYRKLAQCAWFGYGTHDYFCCHGGLSSLNEKLCFIPTSQMINGVGKYSDYEACIAWWDDVCDGNFLGITQFNGHRNINKLPIGTSAFTRNLEGQVEFEGDLRIVKLTRDFSTNEVTEQFYYIHNDVPTAEHLLKPVNEIGTNVIKAPVTNDTPVAELVNTLRANKYVQEKAFGNISSFNFTRDAFTKGVWDTQTIRARGLYIDTVQNKIFARSYEKFFKLKEVPDTQLPSLARTLKFPLNVYLKENGYLGLISYNYYDDSLFFTTKSSPTGDYTKVFKQLFYELTSGTEYYNIKSYLKEHDCTLVVEVIAPDFDPHIIEYEKPAIIALDIIHNTIEFSKLPYAAMQAEIRGCKYLQCKQHTLTINNWEELEDFLKTLDDPVATFDLTGSAYIEGYVIEDSAGFMFKTKSEFYNTWKGLRGVANSVIKTGNYRYTGSLQTPLQNYFYKWIKDNWRYYHDNPDIKSDIITLRNEFLKSKYNSEGQANLTANE
jgi:predicted kinase